jgi:hypothetical protein
MYEYKLGPRQYLSLYNSWFLFPIQTTAAKRCYAKSSKATSATDRMPD